MQYSKRNVWELSLQDTGARLCWENKGTDNWFLQFNATVINQETNKFERLIGFSNLELLPLLNGKMKTHVDATFCCLPSLLKRVLAIIVHDEQIQMFVLCLHALMTGDS